MKRLKALVDYCDDFRGSRPTGSSAEARTWMRLTGIPARHAAELADKGWSPIQVADLMDEAYDDGGDTDVVVDRLLFGPDVA